MIHWSPFLNDRKFQSSRDLESLKPSTRGECSNCRNMHVPSSNSGGARRIPLRFGASLALDCKKPNIARAHNGGPTSARRNSAWNSRFSGSSLGVRCCANKNTVSEELSCSRLSYDNILDLSRVIARPFGALSCQANRTDRVGKSRFSAIRIERTSFARACLTRGHS